MRLMARIENQRRRKHAAATAVELLGVQTAQQQREERMLVGMLGQPVLGLVLGIFERQPS
jgi:hypothetical protein